MDPRKVDKAAGGTVEYTSSPAILVVGDSEASRRRAADAARSAGVRLAGAVGLDDALSRLDRQALTGGVVVEVASTPGAPDDALALERLLRRLNDEAAAGRYASVVSTPASMIDLVAALAPHERIHQLAGASDFDRCAAVALAALPAGRAFRDSSRQGDAARLRHLTDEVGRIAAALARLSADSPAAAGPAPPASPADPVAPIDADEIRAIIRARRLRSQYFDADLFADPAWDMLLDLMAAHVDQQRVAVSSLCIAAAVPATTALRWIKTLTDNGLFVRRADPTDGRRVFIELGEGAARGMRAYLAAVSRLAVAPGMGIAQTAI